MKTKTKITVAVVSVLSVVALAGTGYAGWVISQEKTDSKDGNVEVYNVTNNGVGITLGEFTGSKNSIIWGKPATDTSSITSPWLKADNRQEEFFEPELSFTVFNQTTTDDTKPVVTAKLTITAGIQALTTCATGNLVSVPENVETGVEIKLSEPTHAEKPNEFTYKAKVSGFGWGNHFAVNAVNKNPFVFYNTGHNAYDPLTDGYKDAKTYMDDANNALTDIYSLKDTKFTITITANHGE